MTPRLSLSAARAAWVGPGLQLKPHRNAVATVAVGLDASFSLSAPFPSPAEDLWIALIPPGIRHQLIARGTMVFLYLDALSDDLERLRGADLASLHTRMLEAGTAVGTDWNVDDFCRALGLPADDVVSPLQGSAQIRRAPPSPRLRRAIRALDDRPQDFPRVADAAALAGLSSSRFQAVFTGVTGMPFRRYRLWRRMAVVMRALAAGYPLTAAAFEAGFASSAHLSTTFRAMFGIPPSVLLQGQALDGRSRVSPAPRSPVVVVVSSRRTTSPRGRRKQKSGCRRGRRSPTRSRRAPAAGCARARGRRRGSTPRASPDPARRGCPS